MYTSREVEEIRQNMVKHRWAGSLTIAPPGAVKPDGLLRLWRRLVRRIRLVTHRKGMAWVAAAVPNPGNPGRAHLHILLEDVIPLSVIHQVANRPDFYGLRKELQSPRDLHLRFPKAIYYKPAMEAALNYLLGYKNLMSHQDALLDASWKLIG